ncbi:MAG: endolytic transglycosylase MltG [Bacilli bacterium]|nr:endolytic transglycosylase MltG [Bacilli bacterium]MDD4808744.1 endolytic transglycosylase MltG [Bacilli bacterium]
MQRFASIAFFFVVFFATVITVGCLSYNYGIGAVSKKEEPIQFSVGSGNTYLTISSDLKKNNLIRSELAYKIYIKIFKPKNLQTGNYTLNESLGVKGIVEVLEKGNNNNPDAITVTIPEGRQIEYAAELFAENTNNTKEELLTLWNSDEFIEKVIAKYDFVTDEVKDNRIRYSLEGYFFPSTYELQNVNVDGEYIAYKMLDQMEKVLNKYSAEIKNSKYSIHELLTMASIVEYEAILPEDRPMVAGVFYNRLDINKPLESCATLGYAIGVHKKQYSKSETKTNSPYNTYPNNEYVNGFPPGPGGMPGEGSIAAAIRPTSHDYLYFLANVNNPNDKKTYYSKTYDEHLAKKAQFGL